MNKTRKKKEGLCEKTDKEKIQQKTKSATYARTHPYCAGQIHTVCVLHLHVYYRQKIVILRKVGLVQHPGTNFFWYGLHAAFLKKKHNLQQFNCYCNSITAQSLSCHFPELDLRYLRYYRHRSCHSPPPLADLLKESIGLFALFICHCTYI